MFRWKEFSRAFGLQNRRRLGCSILAASILAVAGCGSSHDSADRLPVYPATGRLIYDGQSLTGAFVVLHPKGVADQKTPRPRGQAAADGSFTLTSYDSNDGAPAGAYAVTVELRPLVKHGGDFSAGPNVLPAKYSRAETSPVTVTIAEGQNELAPIQITK